MACSEWDGSNDEEYPDWDGGEEKRWDGVVLWSDRVNMPWPLL